jgi:tetratricopeptide (TPR) repeat protein
MSVRAIVLVLGLGLSITSLPALAQKESKISKEEAAKRFAEAKQEYSLQEYDKALESFKELYRQTNEPVYLFNIAQCNRQLGNLEEALKGFKAFIQADPNSELKANAQTRITELEAAIAQKKAEEDKLAAEQKRIAEEKRAAELKAIQEAQKRNTKPFFLAAAVTGSAAVVVGGTGLALGQLALAKRDNVTSQEEADKLTRMRRVSVPLTIAGDIAAGVAIASIVTAFVVKKSSAKTETVSILLAPRGGEVMIRF